jgi:alkaline phosphatase
VTFRSRRWLLAPVVAGAVAAAGLSLANPITAADAGAAKGKARNVIFINGDGMAAAQREAARLYLAGFDGQLAMDKLPYSGQLTTSPHDPKTPITDSAAAATAWATGEKTYNGAISVDVDGNPLPTLGAQAKAARPPAWSPRPRSPTPARRPSSPTPPTARCRTRSPGSTWRSPGRT